MPNELENSTYDLLDAGSSLNETSRSTDSVLKKLKRRLKDNQVLSWTITNTLINGLNTITGGVKNLTKPVKGLIQMATFKGAIAGLEEYNELLVTTRASAIAVSRFYKDELVEGIGNMTAMEQATNAVNNSLQELNEYADMTTYIFSDMTNSVNKFVQAGLRIEDATDIAQGLANVLAYTGNNTPEKYANTSLALSRAIQSGKMQLYEWRMFENANIAGKNVSEMLYRVAGAMGKDVGTNFEEEFGSLYEKNANGQFVLKSDISEDEFESFRSSISDWMSADVLAKAFSLIGQGKDLTMDILEAQGITGETAELVLDMAHQGYEQATTIKTLGQLLNAIQEATATSWAGVWTAILGDADQAGQLWTNVLKKFVNESKTGFLDEITNGVDNIAKIASRSSVVEAINLVADALIGLARAFLTLFGLGDFDSLGNDIGNAINVFSGQKVANSSSDLERFAETLRKVAEGMRDLYKNPAFKAIASMIKAIGTAVRNLFVMVSSIVEKLFGSWDGFFNAISGIFERIGRLFGMFTERVASITSSAKGSAGFTNTLNFAGLFSDLFQFGLLITMIKPIGKGITKFVNSFDPASLNALSTFFIGLGVMFAALSLLSAQDVGNVMQILDAVKSLISMIGWFTILVVLIAKLASIIGQARALITGKVEGLASSGGFSFFTLFGDKKSALYLAIASIAFAVAMIMRYAGTISNPLPAIALILVTTGAIGGLVWYLTRLAKNLQKGGFKGVYKDLLAISIVISSLSGVILAIAIAGRIADIGAIGRGMLLLTGAMLAIGAVAGLAYFINEKMGKGGLSLGAVAKIAIIAGIVSALSIVALVLAIVGKIVSIGDVLMAALVMGIILLAVLALIGLAALVSKLDFKALLGLAIIAGVIAVLAVAALAFALVGLITTPESIAKAVVVLLVLVVAVMILMVIAGIVATIAPMALVAIAVVAAAILILAVAMVAFAIAGVLFMGVDPERFLVILGILTAFFAMAGAMGWASAFMIAEAAGMIAIAAAVLLLDASFLLAVPTIYAFAGALMAVALALAAIGIGWGALTGDKARVQLGQDALSSISGSMAVGRLRSSFSGFSSIVNGASSKASTENITDSLDGLGLKLDGLGGGLGNIDGDLVDIKGMLGGGLVVDEDPNSVNKTVVKTNSTDTTDATPSSMRGMYFDSSTRTWVGR